MGWTETANAISSITMALTAFVAALIAYREYKNNQRTETVSTITNAKESIKESCHYMMETAADFWGYCTLFCSSIDNSPEDYTKIHSKIERIRMADDEINLTLDTIKEKIPSQFSVKFDTYQEKLLEATRLYTASMFVAYFTFKENSGEKNSGEDETDIWKQSVKNEGEIERCEDIAEKIMKETLENTEYKDRLNLSDFFFRRCQHNLLNCYTELDCFLSEICRMKHSK